MHVLLLHKVPNIYGQLLDFFIKCRLLGIYKYYKKDVYLLVYVFVLLILYLYSRTIGM